MDKTQIDCIIKYMAKLSFSMVECQKAQTQPLMPSTFFQHSIRKTVSSFAGLSPFSAQLPQSMKHNHDDLENNFWLWLRTNRNEKKQDCNAHATCSPFPNSLLSCISYLMYAFSMEVATVGYKALLPICYNMVVACSSTKLISQNSSGTSERIPKVKKLWA